MENPVRFFLREFHRKTLRVQSNCLAMLRNFGVTATKSDAGSGSIRGTLFFGFMVEPSDYLVQMKENTLIFMGLQNFLRFFEI